jgi:hypothetical protein
MHTCNGVDGTHGVWLSIARNCVTVKFMAMMMANNNKLLMMKATRSKLSQIIWKSAIEREVTTSGLK